MLLHIFIFNILFFIIESDPIFVFEHFRHGSRAPGFGLIKENPMGEYTDRYGVVWKSNGELTGIGLRMEYTLGVRNRYKYKKLISSIIDPKELLVVSSSLNRALTSAQAQLEGMFPPLTGIELKENEMENSIPPIPITESMKQEIKNLGKNALPEKIQIVPIHIFNEKEFEHILSKPSACPPLGKLKDELRNANVFKEFYIKLNNTYGKELMAFFKENNTDFLFDYFNVFFMCDVFLADYYNDRNLSSFEKAGINLTIFRDLAYEMKNLFLFTSECNEEIGVLATSPSIKKIIKWMDNRINRDMNGGHVESNYQDPKFVMYSGHDMTLAPFELFFKKAFGTKTKFPEFGSNMFLELHKPDGIKRKTTMNDYYVVYQIDDEVLLNISYIKFKKRINDIVWSDERILQHCQPPFEGRIVLVVVAGVIVISFALFLTASVLCFNTVKNKKSKRYHSINNKEKYLL